MSLIRLQNISISFGHGRLLDKANLVIHPKQHIGLVGRNGEGKSTLLKILTMEIKPDEGDIKNNKGIVIKRLSQSVPLKNDETVFERVANGLGEVGVALVAYARLLDEPIHGLEEENELSRLQSFLDEYGAWGMQSRIETVLSKMELPSNTKIKVLSGGMRRRVLLAECLLSEPDLLLLDEPTNHLDLSSIQWLESFLKSYPKAFIVVTHDRHFLDAVSNSIIEIDRGGLHQFEGNYAYYQKQKALQLEAEEKANSEFDKTLSKEEVWIRQGIKARRTRNEGRVRALKALRQKRLERREKQQTLSLSGNTVKQSGKMVFEADKLTYNIADKHIISCFSAMVLRGDKIGILGPNGCGKTTLLKLLLGDLAPLEGQLKRGTNLEVAYFDQMRGGLEEEKSLIENVGKGSDFVEIFGEKKHIVSYLKMFLFTPERARAPVKYLSGGEKNRLMLASLFTKKTNVLIFDEPTNDLDIESLEILESFLVSYQGTVLIVSHDRTFLDNVVNSLWVYEGDGHFNEYIGGYEDYLRVHQNKKPEQKKQKSVQTLFKTPMEKGLSKPEKNELKGLPQKIEQLESDIASLEEAFADPDIYSTLDKTALTEKDRKLKSLQKTLEEAYHRWDTLEAKK